MPTIAIDQDNFTTMLARVAHAHDAVTLCHATRMVTLVRLLGQALQLSLAENETLGLGALLHDVGKNAVPDAILHKPGRLDDSERQIVARHTASGHDLLRSCRHPALDIAAEVALYHHECFDGSGYPQGLAGLAIPYHARLVAIADVYDALRSERPYKAGFSHAETIAIITKGDGRTRPEQYDPDGLRALQRQDHAIQTLYREAKRVDPGAGVPTAPE